MTTRRLIQTADQARAFLDGRRSQVRMPYKGSKFLPAHKTTAIVPHKGGGWTATDGDPDRIVECCKHGFASPLGKPGSELWVAEIWQICRVALLGIEAYGVCYKGDDGVLFDKPANKRWSDLYDYKKPWRPPATMPQCASRIRLRVRHVWVERVQEISEEGAKASGVMLPPRTCTTHERTYTNHFAANWDAQYAHKNYGWDKNGWCWCAEVELIKEKQ